MFYTKLGQVVAFLTLLLGVMSLASGIAVMNGHAPIEILAGKTPGEAFDQGIYRIFAGAVLGIFAEISRSVAMGNQVKPD